MSNKLIFEGAGCVPCNDVANCRIRTRIKIGKELIYLEMGGSKQFNIFVGRVDHCFNEKDKLTNYTKELKHIESLRFTYSVKEILHFVNKELGTQFKELVINNNLAVHNTKKELCIGELKKWKLKNL